MQDKKPRELHIEKSIDVINVPYEEPLKKGTDDNIINSRISTLEVCEYYTVQMILVKDKADLHQDNEFQMMYVCYYIKKSLPCENSFFFGKLLFIF